MQSSKRFSPAIKTLIMNLITPPVPAPIAAQFRSISHEESAMLAASLIQHYFSKPFTPTGYIDSDEGKQDLHNHLSGRLESFRKTIIPWLGSVKPLTSARVLEIGCGTGSSTVALAEQGAEVIALDVDEGALIVARERCRAYRLDVTFHKANANGVHALFAGQHFDMVIFFAALEHMTHEERMTSMHDSWDMLSKEDFWCVIETPNRLWFHDGHTSLLPFYYWLPDDVAFLYSRFSPRKSIRDLSQETTDDSKLAFLRKGRGISFHEFDLTMDMAENLDVVSSLSSYLGRRNILREILWRLTVDSQYESFLIKMGPKIHRGFYQPFLDLIIRKQ